MERERTRGWSRRATFALAAAVLATCSAAIGAASAQDTLETHVAACREDPRFLVGGAAIGECLEERRAALDAEIEAMAEREAGRFCSARDGAALEAAQRNWLAYREDLCGVIGRSPGNTASYVNGAACGLLLAERRMEGLKLLADHARPRCIALRLVEEASRPAARLDGSVEVPESGMEWEVTGGFRDQRLLVRDTGRGKTLAEADLSDCTFCDGEDDNCARDGIYVLQDPEVPTRPRILAVCHVGAHSQRLTLFDPVALGPKPALETTAAYALDWRLVRGRLEILLDGEESPSAVFPPDEE